MAVGLRLLSVVAMKNTAVLSRERFDLSALIWAALAGELLAAVAFFASGTGPPVLLRSLQIFLRF